MPWFLVFNMFNVILCYTVPSLSNGLFTSATWMWHFPSSTTQLSELIMDLMWQ